MKTIKTTAAILIASLMGVAATAQKINSTQVPIAVKASFKKAYPAVKTVKWEKEKSDFEAGFKQGDNQMSAVFNADGTQSEAEMNIKTVNLPAPVLGYVKQTTKVPPLKKPQKLPKQQAK